jgi:hypothetical protein
VKIAEPGIYEVSEAKYHADPCEPFSLSRSIAHLMITENPKKAHRAHPKMGGKSDVKPTRAMDDGSIVHALVLGKGADIRPITAVYGPKHERAGEVVTDFNTKAAQEQRDAIRADGGIPVLAHRLPGLRDCAAEMLRQIRQHPDGKAFFAPGRSEAMLVWREGDLLLRIMVDRLPDDPLLPAYDVKMTELSAAPGSWDRRFQTIYAFQDAFYRRGLRAVRGVEPMPLLFPVGELKEPYCMAMHAAAPSLREIADRQVERAIQAWAQCVKTNCWPGYPLFTAWVEASGWQIAAEDEQALRDEIMGEAA